MLTSLQTFRPKKLVNLHDAIIPIVLLKTIKPRQQLPHLDFHHKELKQFEGQTSADEPVKPWSMDIPLTSGGLFLSIYGSYNDYTHWLVDRDHDQFANPPICVFVPQGHVLLWR